jgi:hypothetical protein
MVFVREKPGPKGTTYGTHICGQVSKRLAGKTQVLRFAQDDKI